MSPAAADPAVRTVLLVGTFPRRQFAGRHRGPAGGRRARRRRRTVPTAFADGDWRCLAGRRVCPDWVIVE